MNPYMLNLNAIEDFKKYHGIKNDKDVAGLLGISAPYYSQLAKGERALNEFVRLRIHLLTRKNQDQLFIPQFESDLFPDQSFSYKKFYGVFPILPKKESENNGDPQLRFDGFSKPSYWQKSKKFYEIT